MRGLLMARIKIEDLDLKIELDTMDLDRVVAGTGSYGTAGNGHTNLPTKALPGIGTDGLGL
ncbi:MAG: hypothetical protein AAFN27_11665 [Pseudomonadota bacterium]